MVVPLAHHAHIHTHRYTTRNTFEDYWATEWKYIRLVSYIARRAIVVRYIHTYTYIYTVDSASELPHRSRSVLLVTSSQSSLSALTVYTYIIKFKLYRLSRVVLIVKWFCLLIAEILLVSFRTIFSKYFTYKLYNYI